MQNIVIYFVDQGFNSALSLLFMITMIITVCNA